MSDVTVQKVPRDAAVPAPTGDDWQDFLARIRERAFQLFSRRGAALGCELDDWLAAEREVLAPHCELIEREKELVCTLALPGFDAADVTVSVTPRELVVQATRRLEQVVPPKAAGTLRWSSLSREDVYRRIGFGADVVPERVTATLKQGLLQVVAPKAATAASAPTPVKVAAAA